jgi:hypothetical protein
MGYLVRNSTEDEKPSDLAAYDQPFSSSLFFHGALIPLTKSNIIPMENVQRSFGYRYLLRNLQQ